MTERARSCVPLPHERLQSVHADQPERRQSVAVGLLVWYRVGYPVGEEVG